MRCPKCGSEIGERRNYCPFCGTRLSIPFSPQHYVHKHFGPLRLSSMVVPILAIAVVIIIISVFFVTHGNSYTPWGHQSSLDGLEINSSVSVDLWDHAVIYISITNKASQGRSAYVVAEFQINGSSTIMHGQDYVLLDPGQTKVFSITFFYPDGVVLENLEGYEYTTYLSETGL